MSDYLKEIKSRLPPKKYLRLIILCAFAVIILLAGELTSQSSKESSAESFSYVNSSDYIKSTEKQLQQILEQIDGAGEVRVMITLENTFENVYAKAYENQNKQGEGSSEGNIKESYVTVKNGSNNEECLILKVYEPKIKGVAVVCTGADNLNVKKAVTETVCALFDISSAKVSVTKMIE